MFLKRLEIIGFKSFATKTVLDFEKTDQIAAIVGPNGSGKSNVADAIRWVLGETSYKSLRSKKSEDVIFSGSDNRSRASMAKVTMVLDNEDRKAPIDFTEVSVSRSVVRDGSSEYLIAGKKSRLIDVAELLAQAGFGQSTYSVIGQGMVDSMLFYGPAERKVLFDEAAGVRVYELKREQTLKKLEDTNANIVRIKDIFAELNPRLATLKKQAEKAQEKDLIREQLLSKQKVYYASIWDKLNQQERELRNDLEKVIIEQSKVEREASGLNEKFNQILSEEQEKNKDTNSLNQKIESLEEQKDNLRQKIFKLRAQLEVNINELTKSEITERIKELQTKLEQLNTEDLENHKNKLQVNLESLALNEANQEIAKLEEEKDDLKQEVFTLKNKIEMTPIGLTAKELKEKIAQLQAEYNNLDEKGLRGRTKGAEKEIDRAEDRLMQVEIDIKSVKEKIYEVSNQVSELDFGQVGEKLGAILYLQNDFLLRIEAIRDISEIKRLIKDGKEIATRLKILRKEIGAAKEDRIAIITELQKKLEELLLEKESLTKEINRKKAEIYKYNYELQKIADRRFKIEKELGELTSCNLPNEKEKKALYKEIKEKEKKIEEINNKIQLIRENFDKGNDLKSEIMRLELQINQQMLEREQIETEIQKLNSITPRDESAKGLIEKEILTYQAEIAKIQDQIKLSREKLQEHTNFAANRAKILNELKDAIAQKQLLLSEYNIASTNLQVDLGKIETKRQDIKEEISRELGDEYLLVDAEVIPELDEERARIEIEKIKSSLYAIGEIDPEVESEFKEVSERVSFLNHQIDDLEKAKKDLEKLLKELDTKIKKHFNLAFEAIAKKFGYFFDILFGGGTAKLELVEAKDEEENRVEYGIEIVAIPPGKRVKSLSSLSGGERTLTSLALLFAILSVNPSPFCVLDEVDAALDEANTNRFLKIVRELSNKTQFIFITHNRETMKAASVIYGITMDESRASKLLSIKLDDALKTAS